MRANIKIFIAKTQISLDILNAKKIEEQILTLINMSTEGLAFFFALSLNWFFLTKT